MKNIKEPAFKIGDRVWIDSKHVGIIKKIVKYEHDSHILGNFNFVVRFKPNINDLFYEQNGIQEFSLAWLRLINRKPNYL